jgi:acyl carrier protein
MVPAAFVELEALPLTANGKVDRRALAERGAAMPEVQAGYEEPRTAVEELLCGLWEEVLGAERVGIRDNFFELGGHSLLATQVVSRIRELLECDFPLRTLFESPTVAEMAEVLQTLSEEEEEEDFESYEAETVEAVS